MDRNYMLRLLREAQLAKYSAEERVEELVIELRRPHRGTTLPAASWSEIAHELGMTKQGAHDRYRRLTENLEPDDTSI